VVDPVRGASRPVSLNDVAPALRLATVAVEDGSFESNPGVDVVAMSRALVQDIQSRRIVAGGSTITQQLAKLRYLPSDQRDTQSVQRKLLESWLAVRLTGTLSKDTILEQYLNSAPYGNLAVGAEAAARTYFGKPARELSLAEAALLAGLPQSPTDYDPFTRLEVARSRQRLVLELMQRHSMISEAQAESARAERLQLNERPFSLSAAHFVDYIRSIAPADAMRIETTLDRDIQALAERAAQRQVVRLADHDVSDAAVVVLDPHTGEVLAMVGGVDYFDAVQPGAQVNMAIAPRQPGSAFKPITYAAAIESGQFNEASILDDTRTVFRTRRGDTYIPEDYDHQFHGRVPLRVALASSLNVPAVQVEASIGVSRVLELAQHLGVADPFDDPTRFDLSLTLGGAEVRLLDLTAAYGAFANGGIFHPAVTIKSSDSGGARRVMSDETVWLIDDILSDDAARGPGFGRDGVLRVPGRTVAVKTGTTSDFRDNWTVGFTPDVVVGVWVGNPDNHPMRDVSGVSGAAPLWRDVLDGVLDGRPATAFQRPVDLAQTALCASSEEPAGPPCPSQRLEWLRPTDVLSFAAPPRSGVRITFPDPDSVIALDASVPLAVQQVAIEVSAVDRVTVFVDGAPVGSREGSGPIIWLPTPGRHVLTAVNGQAHSEAVGIDVVPS
jgi:penicillin-binding protein 1C